MLSVARYGIPFILAKRTKWSLVTHMHASAFTRCLNASLKWSKLSHLSDPQTIRSRFFSVPNELSAASRLCALVHFESSTRIIPFFCPIFSRRCGSHWISLRCLAVLTLSIPSSSVMSVLASILRALCMPENVVLLSLYAESPAIIIFSQSVVSTHPSIP